MPAQIFSASRGSAGGGSRGSSAWDGRSPDRGEVLVESANTTAAPGAQRRLRRDVGRVGLLFTSVGSIIGSGGLLGALAASAFAGPAALISWVLGGGAMLLLALVHAELGGMYPVAGGSARFPHYAFGSL